jgi:imidazoleglycerol-phosphate dehydratase
MTRKTKETEVDAELTLTGGPVEVNTGIGFFDHMLTAMAFHAGWGLKVKAQGDLHVDAHHTVEDVGIVLGLALKDALPIGRARFGHAFIPMDEALGFAAVDAGGRAYLRFEAQLPELLLDNYDAALTKEFFQAFSQNALLTLHMKADGENAHHITEALFKAAGAALRAACAERGNSGAASTKGAF